MSCPRGCLDGSEWKLCHFSPCCFSHISCMLGNCWMVWCERHVCSVIYSLKRPLSTSCRSLMDPTHTGWTGLGNHSDRLDWTASGHSDQWVATSAALVVSCLALVKWSLPCIRGIMDTAICCCWQSSLRLLTHVQGFNRQSSAHTLIRLPYGDKMWKASA